MKSAHHLSIVAAFAVSMMLVGCQSEDAHLILPEPPVEYTPQFVSLPSSPALQKTFEATSAISVQNGGILSINAYDPDDPRSIYYEISLTFDPGTVPYDITASIHTDSQNLMYLFEPHGTIFSKPAKFSAKFSGLNLSWVKPGSTVSLWYEGPSGWTRMNGTVKYDISAGTMECLDGELPHFSRYGFGI